MIFRLLARQGAWRFELLIDDVLAADIHCDLCNLAPNEAEGRLILPAHRISALVTNNQAFSRQRELAWLHAQHPLGCHLVVDKELQHASGNARGPLVCLAELCAASDLAGWNSAVRGEPLFLDTQEVVDVVRPASLHEKRLPAEARALCEVHSCRLGRLEDQLRCGAEGLVTNVRGNLPGHLSRIWMVSVVGARLRVCWLRGGDALTRPAVIYAFICAVI